MTIGFSPPPPQTVIVAIVETKSSRATPETTVVAKISLLAIAGIAVLGCKVDGHINSLLANQRLHDPSLGGHGGSNGTAGATRALTISMAFHLSPHFHKIQISLNH